MMQTLYLYAGGDLLLSEQYLSLPQQTTSFMHIVGNHDAVVALTITIPPALAIAAHLHYKLTTANIMFILLS